MLSKVLAQLKTHPEFGSQFTYEKILPGRGPIFSPPQIPLPVEIVEALRRTGIHGLYSHQALALDLVREGKHAVAVTPTASGKTLVYTLPVLETLLHDPQARALYLFPLKALEQDQFFKFQALAGPLGVTASIYDGDTPASRRRKIRAHLPQVLITNPDMLHLGLLPFHPQWEPFFRTLKFVVIDELHTYKGIFGSHVAQVLRRLRRVCRFYGTEPQFIACSATIGNPREFAERLVGLPFEVVAESGAPRREQHLFFLNPRESAYTLATRLFIELVEAGLKTIAFTKARKITELLYTWTLQQAPHLKGRVSAYRAGFLPEERREIERRLFGDELHGVIATSALEMGVDIGGLDACLLVGYPGTIAATWQRAGRVGRGERESLILLIAQPDALDQYFMRHPEDFFARPFEAAVVDPHNRYVEKAHLVCAAAELPLRARETTFDLHQASPLLKKLEEEGRLLRSAAGSEWFAAERRPQRTVDIRAAGESYTIWDADRKQPIGQVSGSRVFSECHPGAIYLHLGRQYVVTELDLTHRDIFARATEVEYFTRAQGRKESEILETWASKTVARFQIVLGRLKITEWVESYEKRRILGQDLLSTHPLSLPPQIFETVGFWIILNEEVEEGLREEGYHFSGTIHAAEHAAIGLFPLFALSDRGDIGGISYPFHPQVGQSAIFIYDGYPGGVGLAERGYEVIEDLLQATLTLLRECPCEEGCPSCVHSPKCGSGNRPLDKGGARRLLELLLGEAGGPVPEVRGAEPLPEVGSGSPSPLPVDGRILILDVETQHSAAEVGGWQFPHLMRLGVAALYDLQAETVRIYSEAEVHELLRALQAADLVVGYNIKRFDYGVLRGYTDLDFSRIPTLDLMEEISGRLGYRLSLAHLAQVTLGLMKTADGLQSLAWFKAGELEKVIQYCKQDVELTRGLFQFGRAHGYLLFERDGQHLRVPVRWARPERLTKES